MVQAEDSQAQVHLGLQKAAAANEKYKHILMKTEDLLGEMFKQKKVRLD